MQASETSRVADSTRLLRHSHRVFTRRLCDDMQMLNNSVPLPALKNSQAKKFIKQQTSGEPRPPTVAEVARNPNIQHGQVTLREQFHSSSRDRHTRGLPEKQIKTHPRVWKAILQQRPGEQNSNVSKTVAEISNQVKTHRHEQNLSRDKTPRHHS